MRCLSARSSPDRVPIGLGARSDPGKIRFLNTMDELNHMMHARSLDGAMQRKLRLFFIQARPDGVLVD